MVLHCLGRRQTTGKILNVNDIVVVGWAVGKNSLMRRIG